MNRYNTVQYRGLTHNSYILGMHEPHKLCAIISPSSIVPISSNAHVHLLSTNPQVTRPKSFKNKYTTSSATRRSKTLIDHTYEACTQITRCKKLTRTETTSSFYTPTGPAICAVDPASDTAGACTIAR